MYASPAVPCLCPVQGFEPQTLAYLCDAPPLSWSPGLPPTPCLAEFSTQGLSDAGIIILKWILVVYACAQSLTEV